jgi:hypothetical protein
MKTDVLDFKMFRPIRLINGETELQRGGGRERIKETFGSPFPSTYVLILSVESGDKRCSERIMITDVLDLKFFFPYS